MILGPTCEALPCTGLSSTWLKNRSLHFSPCYTLHSVQLKQVKWRMAQIGANSSTQFSSFHITSSLCRHSSIQFNAALCNSDQVSSFKSNSADSSPLWYSVLQCGSVQNSLNEPKVAQLTSIHIKQTLPVLLNFILVLH